MSTLSKELRRQLENTVLKAREEAERGAAAALESYGVADAKLPGHLDDAGKVLRRKLRAHGRQVGDVRRPDDSQEVERLRHECAYEHWHRMLFARFLAENGFLIEPESGLDVDFAHCEEEAKRLGIDTWEMASRFAQKMLPGIFRPDDPVLQVRLPAESRNRLTALLASLPRDVFLADDSLGWVYQFWQTEQKKKINKSEVPIGADELAPVTQLFTEDYMVEFLLHNTLGAWWTAKRHTEGKSQPIPFAYLRLKVDGAPAAGAFEGWPKSVKQLRVLDPCMGSGHFLVFALIILVRMRMEEEGLSAADACVAVLRDNLFGLELDPRCTQIAAFNLALAAWKLGGYQRELPNNLACSGLGLNAKKEDWLRLAESNDNIRFSMGALFDLFQKAPVLGSLINPRRDKSVTYSSKLPELQPLLQKALQREVTDEAHELAVTAQGVAKAAEILAGQFTLVATNVPFLGREKQCEILEDHVDRYYLAGKSDLACAMQMRCLELCEPNGFVATVSPQYWLFLGRYENFRRHILATSCIGLVAKLGTGAFETISGEVVNTCLTIYARAFQQNTTFVTIDVGSIKGASGKKLALCSCDIDFLPQKEQEGNPNAVIGYKADLTKKLLAEYCYCFQGLATSDNGQFVFQFWEVPIIANGWETFQMAPEDSNATVGGLSWIIFWEDGQGKYSRHAAALKAEGRLGGWKSGREAWGKIGIAINRMSNLPVALYGGAMFDCNVAVVIPNNESDLSWIWTFLRSQNYKNEVRRLTQKTSVTNLTLIKIPVDREEQIELETLNNIKPLPHTNDPTQWLFNGHPEGSDHPLQVAVARLAGYRWPRQTGSDFPDCPALGEDGLEKHADNDGVVCFSQARDEAPAAERLRALLADAYGAEWSHAMERKLIAATGSKAESLENWLVNDFFTQHCDLFHDRPFVWHIWDGRKDGFNVLINYHKLAGPKGEGHRTLETLAYAYLGDWITRQKDAAAHGEAGAEDRLAAAQELLSELKKISAGEPPFDLFIRWKGLAAQAIGWNPDINDGVRLNIRPFMTATLSRGKKGCGLFPADPGSGLKWGKDKGKEPMRSKEDFPWFWKWDEQTVDFTGNGEFDGNRWNDCHYTTAFKKAAREAKSKK